MVKSSAREDGHLPSLDRTKKGGRSDRERESHARGSFVKEYPVLFVENAEEFTVLGNRFGRTEEENSILSKREMKDFNGAILRIIVEVNKQVAARNQIHAAERSVLEQVMGSEEDCF